VLSRRAHLQQRRLHLGESSTKIYAFLLERLVAENVGLRRLQRLPPRRRRVQVRDRLRRVKILLHRTGSQRQRYRVLHQQEARVRWQKGLSQRRRRDGVSHQEGVREEHQLHPAVHHHGRRQTGLCVPSRVQNRT
jgi:hypothetical protein